VTKNVLQFSLTGEAFNIDKLGEILSAKGVEELQ
jgi:hypothetical protein